MRRVGAVGVLLAATVLLATSATASAASSPQRPRVVELKLSGVVDPFVADYIRGGIARAQSDGAAAVLLVIDTPGGLDSSMREIDQAILNAKISVICYTAPSGARAASAGTFVMLACPVNAMAPGTEIGAAHPVGVSGAIESAKVTNDAAAYIQSLAERWGRNARWPVSAVRQAASISAEQALAFKVVDYVADSTTDLFNQIGDCARASTSLAIPPKGSTQPTRQSPRVCGADVVSQGIGFGAGFFHVLIDPNLAFLFFWVGLILLVIEFLHPGISVPGILGAVFLVTAFVEFGFFSVQVVGVVFLIAAALFFLLEIKHPGIGVPTIGGTICLVLGGLLLFNSAVPTGRVSPWVIGLVAVIAVVFFGFVVGAAIRTRRLPKPQGLGSLVGEEGVAIDDLAPAGRVRVQHEAWSGQAADGTIAKGSGVRVVSREGLTLVVEATGEIPAKAGAGATVQEGSASER